MILAQGRDTHSECHLRSQKGKKKSTYVCNPINTEIPRKFQNWNELQFLPFKRKIKVGFFIKHIQVSFAVQL